MTAKPIRSNTFAIAAGSGAAYSMNSNPLVPAGFSQGVNFMSLAYAHRKLTETAEADPLIALRHAGPGDARKALEQRVEGDPRLHAGNVHSRAGVVAVAEGDVAVGLAADVEAVGLGELRRVAVGGADAQGDGGAFGEALAAKLERRSQSAVVELDRALVAQ